MHLWPTLHKVIHKVVHSNCEVKLVDNKAKPAVEVQWLFSSAFHPLSSDQTNLKWSISFVVHHTSCRLAHLAFDAVLSAFFGVHHRAGLEPQESSGGSLGAGGQCD